MRISIRYINNNDFLLKFFFYFKHWLTMRQKLIKFKNKKSIKLQYNFNLIENICKKL